MSGAPRPVDLTQVPAVPWAWVDELRLRRHPWVQRESAPERTAIERGLSVPAD
jgi:hypothetical protein